MASDQQPQVEEIYIAVVGVAGAGKDSLISSFSADHTITNHTVDDACKSTLTKPLPTLLTRG